MKAEEEFDFRIVAQTEGPRCIQVQDIHFDKYVMIKTEGVDDPKALRIARAAVDAALACIEHRRQSSDARAERIARLLRVDALETAYDRMIVQRNGFESNYKKHVPVGDVLEVFVALADRFAAEAQSCRVVPMERLGSQCGAFEDGHHGSGGK